MYTEEKNIAKEFLRLYANEQVVMDTLAEIKNNDYIHSDRWSLVYDMIMENFSAEWRKATTGLVYLVEDGELEEVLNAINNDIEWNFGDKIMADKVNAFYVLAKEILDMSKDIGEYSDEEIEMLNKIVNVVDVYENELCPKDKAVEDIIADATDRVVSEPVGMSDKEMDM